MRKTENLFADYASNSGREETESTSAPSAYKNTVALNLIFPKHSSPNANYASVHPVCLCLSVEDGQQNNIHYQHSSKQITNLILENNILGEPKSAKKDIRIGRVSSDCTSENESSDIFVSR